MAVDTLLDLDGISQRAEKVTFEVLDSSLNVTGTITPVHVGSVENNATAAIKRRLTGFRLSATDYNAVNTLTDRIRPSWVLSDGRKFPLGLFLFADASSPRRSWGRELEATLVDQGLILSQPLSATVGFPTGTSVAAAAGQVAALAGVMGAAIDASPVVTSSPLAWPAGKSGTTYSKVLDDLAALGGYYPAYFSNAGQLLLDTVVDVPTAAAALIYADGGRIVTDSIVEANDLLTAPNRYIVVDTSATDAPITATYDIPANVPYSATRRGFVIPRFVDAPGIGSQAAALVLAAQIADSDVAAFETVQFSGPADPRHDTFDVVSFRGVNYLEVGWRLNLAAGGPHDHQLRRVYR
jgi:hypothetical protein